MSYPVDHLSLSMCRTLLSNPYIFKLKYIDKVYVHQPTDAMLLGSAVHKYLELSVDQDKNAYNEAKLILDESLHDKFDFCVECIKNEPIQLGDVQEVEASLTQDYIVGGVKAPLPLKCVVDVISRNDKDELLIWDYKTKSKFTSHSEDDPGYILQAMFYYYAVKEAYGEAPVSMNFLELKTSKNRDGSSQFSTWTVDYSIQEYHRVFRKFYISILKELENRTVYTPNFFDMMTGKESWDIYINQ